VLDGANPLPALAEGARSPHRELAFAYAHGTALRQGDLKIVRHDAKKAWELYDLAADRAEQRDLAAAQPERVRDLATRWQALQERFVRDAGELRPLKPTQGRSAQRGKKTGAN